MKERFLAAAEAEYLAEALFYEARSPGLGERFVAEIDEALAVVHEYPGCGSPYLRIGAGSEIRSMLLRSFPVQVFYVVREDTLIVVGVAHTSRRPGYWRDRLRELT